MKRLILNLFLFILAGIIWLTPAWATGVYDLPSPDSQTWIIDQAEVISRSNEGKINSELAKLAKNTGNEVRIVVLRRLDYGQDINGFSDELLTTWFPDTESQANQTILVLDTLTNNVALVEGEGIKTLLDDTKVTSIIDETLNRTLKEGNKYNQAILEASDRLVAILSGQPDPGPTLAAEELNLDGTFTEAEETKKSSATLWVIGLLVLATIIPMATYFFYVGFSN